LTPKDLTLLRPLIVVPAYKSLQRIKFVSPPFVQVRTISQVYHSSAGGLRSLLYVLSHIVPDASEIYRLNILFCVPVI